MGKYIRNKAGFIILAVLLSSAILVSCTTMDLGYSEAKGEDVYPLNTENKLEIWCQLPEGVYKTNSTMNDIPLTKQLIKETGINISYTHPAYGSEVQQFNILLAMDELPDIVMHTWSALSGGSERYIQNQTILRLNDLIDKYSPHFKKYIKENKDVDDLIKTPSGNYYMYPCILENQDMSVTSGLVIRDDLLRELNLDVPETIDEWDTVLRAFKDKGVKTPFGIEWSGPENVFAYAYNIYWGMYLDDGVVKYGPAEPAAADFLERLNIWYSDGLLDQNFAYPDRQVFRTGFAQGSIGATNGHAGSMIGDMMDSVTDENYSLTAVPMPSLVKGEKSRVSTFDSRVLTYNEAAITQNCKVPEVAARFLDFGYSDRGHMLYNFGIEGESYNMVDGYPRYSELITNNPDLSFWNAVSQYILSTKSGPFVQDSRYMEQLYRLPQQKVAPSIWENEGDIQRMSAVKLTGEEMDEVGRSFMEIRSYTGQMKVKFIMGLVPMSEYPVYVEQLREMGLDRVLEVYQAAYDRFENNR